MKFTVVHILLLIVALLVYQCARAQDFVVTTAGDTLRGTVKAIPGGIDKKVLVTTADKQKSSHSILKVKSYSQDGEVYHTVRHPEGYKFMKVIKSGYLSLYGFQMEGQVAFDGRYMLKRDGRGLEVPNLSFKKYVKQFLSDCPDVVAKIDAKEFAKKDIDRIVDEYNSCIDGFTKKQGDAIVRQQELQKDAASWADLETKIKNAADFNRRNDAIEMVTEIKTKVLRNEKVPNFLIEGLRSSLAGTDLTSDFEKAVATLSH